MRKGLIKCFIKNLRREEMIVGSYIPKHLKLSFPKKPVILSISSDSKTDDILNEGAKLLIINGLDEEYNEINDIVKLRGHVQVSSNKYFYRVNNVIVIECGRLKSNQGNIYITSTNDRLKKGIPCKSLYHVVGKGENLSCCGIYTVPKGFNMQMTRFNTTTECRFCNYIISNTYIKPIDMCNLEIAEIYYNRYNGNTSYPIEYCTIVGEKTDVSLCARKKGFGNAKYGCYFQYYLEEII